MTMPSLTKPMQIGKKRLPITASMDLTELKVDRLNSWLDSWLKIGRRSIIYEAINALRPA